MITIPSYRFWNPAIEGKGSKMMKIAWMKESIFKRFSVFSFFAISEIQMECRDQS